MAKKALGKGLEALFEGPSVETVLSDTLQVEVGRIIPNRYQPRSDFDEAGLRELTESVRRTGVLQPVLLRRRQDGQFELIAGERRWRAAQAAGLEKIPAIFKEATDDELLAFALIENIQRRDLNAIEAARAYRRLVKDFQMTQDEIALRVGKDRSSIANALRLLTLPQQVQEMIGGGQMSPGHAKALLMLSRSVDQVRLAREIVRKGLSVRQAERGARQSAEPSTRKGTGNRRSVEISALEDRLRRYLATPVRISARPKGGRLTIEFFSLSDLDRVAELILSK